MAKYFSVIVLILLFCPFAYAQDNYNKALLLDGNKNYVEIPHNDVFNFNGNFTIEFRVKMNSDKPGAVMSKWTNELPDNAHKGWFLSMNLVTVPPDSGDMSISNDPFRGIRQDGVVGFGSAGWYNTDKWIISRSGSHHPEATGIWRFHVYTYGTLLDSSFHNYYTRNSNFIGGGGRKPSTNFDTPGKALNIGGFHLSIDSTLYIDGLIDEIRIWNVTRTREQVFEAWNDTLGPEYYMNPESGLVAYYRFDKLENLGVGDDGMADDVRDLTLYGNHGDIKGTAVVVDPDAVTSVENNIVIVPSAFSLHQNYPNPFNGGTVIKYTLPSASDVVLKIFNSTGQEIKTLHSGFAARGLNSAEWDGTNSFGLQVSSGIYFYSLRFDGKVKYKKMLYMK